MNKILPYLLFSVASLVFTSCGRFDRIDNGGQTKVTFQRSKSSGNLHANAGVLSGGIIIYAYSPSFATNIKLTDETQQASINLPNGNYSFYAFGYAGSFGTALDIRCAVTGNPTPLQLTGIAQTIPLTLSIAGCANGAFSQSNDYLDGGANTAGSIFAQIELVHCGTIVGTTLAGGMAGGANCASSGWSSANRYQIVSPLFAASSSGVFNRIGEAHRSGCYAGNTSGSAIASSVRLPVGSTSGPIPTKFPLEIETFSDSSCTSTPIARHKFYKGLIFGPNPDASELAAIAANTGATNKTKVFLREP